MFIWCAQFLIQYSPITETFVGYVVTYFMPIDIHLVILEINSIRWMKKIIAFWQKKKKLNRKFNADVHRPIDLEIGWQHARHDL